jgi:hypothetical protein
MNPLLSYPARPTNGGALERALPKVGAWAWQPKIDDWRVVIHVPTRRVWNREGEPSAIRHKIARALDLLPPVFDWLDAGVVGLRTRLALNSIVVFDYMPPTGEEGATYSERRTHLEEVFDDELPRSIELATGPQVRDRVFLIPEYARADERANVYWNHPLAIYQALQAENAELGKLRLYEGLVAKRIDKPYPLQLRSPRTETPWMVKHRFDQ